MFTHTRREMRIHNVREVIGLPEVFCEPELGDGDRNQILQWLETYNGLLPQCQRLVIAHDSVGALIPSSMMALEDIRPCIHSPNDMILLINMLRWSAMPELREHSFVATLLTASLERRGDLWVEDDGEVVLSTPSCDLTERDALDFIARTADLAMQESHRDMIIILWGDGRAAGPSRTSVE